MNWKPIETAPRDGTKFLALVGEAIYVAEYDGKMFVWYSHSNKASGRHYKILQIDGVEYQKEITPAQEPNYQVCGHIYIRGFKDEPTMWTELELPKE